MDHPFIDFSFSEDDLNINEHLEIVKDTINANKIDEEKESEDDDNDHQKLSIEIENLKSEHQEISFKLAYHNFLFRKILENLQKSQENLRFSLKNDEENSAFINRLDNETVFLDNPAKIKRNYLEKSNVLLKNLEKSEKALFNSFELETEIVNLLQKQTEKPEKQELLDQISRFQKENEELYLKIKDLESRKSLALDFLRKYDFF